MSDVSAIMWCKYYTYLKTILFYLYSIMCFLRAIYWQSNFHFLNFLKIIYKYDFFTILLNVQIILNITYNFFTSNCKVFQIASHLVKSTIYE